MFAHPCIRKSHPTSPLADYPPSLCCRNITVIGQELVKVLHYHPPEPCSSGYQLKALLITQPPETPTSESLCTLLIFLFPHLTHIQGIATKACSPHSNDPRPVFPNLSTTSILTWIILGLGEVCVLCIIGCLPVALTSTPWMPVTFSKYGNQNCPQILPNVLLGDKIASS